MKLDDDVCLCFHVPLRKIIRFVRIEKPNRASQLSQCFGAGTGCGWCRPFLKKILEEYSAQPESTGTEMPASLNEITPESYQAQRKAYRQKKAAPSDSPGNSESE